MKKSVFVILLFLGVIHAEGFSQDKKDKFRAKPDTVSVDSLEYRLIVLDPDLRHGWQPSLQRSFIPKSIMNKGTGYMSLNGIRGIVSPGNNSRYETYIDYNPHTDYGLDINYRLYYYFKYFEETNHIRLINIGR